MDDALDLSDLVRAEIARQANPYQVMVVDSLQEDGTVNLRWGETILNGVPAQVSYSPRSEGDVVLVLNHAAGWRVMDRVGGPVTLPEVDQVTLTFGPPAPGADFAEAMAVYVKDGHIYVQTGEGPGGPGQPPTTSTPKPQELDPTGSSGYRNGRRDTARIAQGAWRTYPQPWTSVWTFGTTIRDACVGQSVARMDVRVARTKNSHGTSGKVRPRLGTISQGSPPSSTPDLSNRWDGTGLGLGQSAWHRIPQSAVDDLISGDARGIGISAGVGNDYLVATNSCGEVRITFG